MPIYEYLCSTCGFKNDYLQKISEPQLTDCPECGKSTFAKQVTAAGFQLKGTGWYATDFKSKGTEKSGTGKEAKGAEPAAATDAGAKPDTGAKPDAPVSSAGASPAGS